MFRLYFATIISSPSPKFLLISQDEEYNRLVAQAVFSKMEHLA